MGGGSSTHDSSYLSFGDSSSKSVDTAFGAIQVLRNADLWGWGVSDFLEKNVTKV